GGDVEVADDPEARPRLIGNILYIEAVALDDAGRLDVRLALRRLGPHGERLTEVVDAFALVFLPLLARFDVGPFLAVLDVARLGAFRDVAIDHAAGVDAFFLRQDIGGDLANVGLRGSATRPGDEDDRYGEQGAESHGASCR